MGAAKALHMAPRKIAEVLASQLKLEGSWFESVEVAGAGFLTFRLGDGSSYEQIWEHVRYDIIFYGSRFGKAFDGFFLLPESF